MRSLQYWCCTVSGYDCEKPQETSDDEIDVIMNEGKRNVFDKIVKRAKRLASKEKNSSSSENDSTPGTCRTYCRSADLFIESEDERGSMEPPATILAPTESAESIETNDTTTQNQDSINELEEKLNKEQARVAELQEKLANKIKENEQLAENSEKIQELLKQKNSIMFDQVKALEQEIKTIKHFSEREKEGLRYQIQILKESNARQSQLLQQKEELIRNHESQLQKNKENS